MKKYGFNLQYMFVSHGQAPKAANERELDFIAKHGFNFIRIPTDYQFWTTDFDYFHPNEDVLTYLDGYLAACEQRGLHMCLNLHRAPGYCINNNQREKHNLWQDEVALEAFVFTWTMLAKRYKGVSSDKLSFDLLNEPPSEGQYGFTRDIHQKVMRTTIDAIRAVDPDRCIVLDGIGAGGVAIPELADAGVIHSGRGYEPFFVSHNGASWCGDIQWTEPVYPGLLNGKHWDRAALEAYYAPWLEVAAQGVEVHIGEFGCYNKTPNDIALRWLSDLLGLYKKFGWGYSLWQFDGPFGIVNHGRPGAVYTEMDGFMVDKMLLDLLEENRVANG